MQDSVSTSELLTLFQSRRTCYQFDNAPGSGLSEEDLNLCLEAARWAPNHKLTQPWRYWVVGPESRKSLTEIYADNRARYRAADECDYDCFYRRAVEKFDAIPQVILVGQQLSDDAVIRKEDYAACACAIQNFQLMAWHLGIGVQWSTGPILKDRRTYELLQSDPERVELVGALYMGHPKAGCGQSKRKPLDEIVTRLD